jgi:hypothetical protein
MSSNQPLFLLARLNWKDLFKISNKKIQEINKRDREEKDDQKELKLYIYICLACVHIVGIDLCI